jgi:hypothetical protein
MTDYESGVRRSNYSRFVFSDLDEIASIQLWFGVTIGVTTGIVSHQIGVLSASGSSHRDNTGNESRTHHRE